MFSKTILCISILMLSGCSAFSKQDVKTVVDVAKTIVEEVCTPGNPSLDACIDRLLTDPRVQSAKMNAKKESKDAGAAE